MYHPFPEPSYGSTTVGVTMAGNVDPFHIFTDPDDAAHGYVIQRTRDFAVEYEKIHHDFTGLTDGRYTLFITPCRTRLLLVKWGEQMQRYMGVRQEGAAAWLLTLFDTAVATYTETLHRYVRECEVVEIQETYITIGVRAREDAAGTSWSTPVAVAADVAV